MFIFYELETGDVKFTINADKIPHGVLSPQMGYIESDNDIGELTGLRVVDGALIRYSIDAVKQNYLNKVLLAMSDIRAKFITALPGQDMIYLKKEGEAKSYLASENPNLSDYPLISAEIGVTAPTAYEVAQIWVQLSYMWAVTASELEKVRLTCVNAINEASTEGEVENAYSEFLNQISSFN